MSRFVPQIPYETLPKLEYYFENDLEDKQVMARIAKRKRMICYQIMSCFNFGASRYKIVLADNSDDETIDVSLFHKGENF